MIAASLKIWKDVAKNKIVEAHSTGKIRDDLNVTLENIGVSECEV